MRISVIDPISRAWDRMVQMLFKPFDIVKWFGLGFCFFLANLGRGGGGGGGGYNYSPGGPGGGGPGGNVADEIWRVVDTAIQWVKDNFALALTVAVGGYLLITLLWALFLWLRCRGAFMVIDNLAFNRGEVVRPWKDFRGLGNNLFRFELVVGLSVSVFSVAVIVVAGFIAWPDIVNHIVGTNLLWAAIILVVVLPLTWVNYIIMIMLLVDFIVPTMYLHDLTTTAAWKRWYRDIFKGHFWKLTLFYLMKLLLGMAAGAVILALMCVTCCIASCFLMIPYIGTVVLLPVFVFMRCYTLYFIEQFGEPWRIFIYEDGSVICLSCGYDLRGNLDSTHCPECGHPTPMQPSAGPEPWDA